MKLFYFNPNSYGEEFFVMSDDKINAHKDLMKFLKERTKDPYYGEYYKEDIKRWKNVNPLIPETFPQKYTLDEYEKGQVFRSEIA